MVKGLKWIKKYSFLIMATVLGVIYLSFVDSWQVYAKPLRQLKSWYEQREPGDGRYTEESYTVSRNNTVSSGSDENFAGNGMAAGSEEAGKEADGQNVQVSGGDAEEGQSTTVSEGNVGNGQSMTQQDGNTEGEQAVTRSPEDVVYQTVEDDYFSDAVFIGDSRTVGMYEYGGLEEISTFYASTGLTVYKLFDSPIVQIPGQKEKKTIEEALSENSFSKIYLMIGINEMGTGTVETFMEKYKEVVEHLQELQPDATIYLQGIMKKVRIRKEHAA